VDKQGSEGNDNKQCFKCKEKGHIARDCSNKKKDQVDAFIFEMSLNGEEDNYH